MLLSVIGQETGVTSSTNQMDKKVELRVFSSDSVLFLQVHSLSLLFFRSLRLLT